MNSLTYFALRPVGELAIWGWRLERRTEFLWRDQFDHYLRPPLFAAAQTLTNAGKSDQGLALAEERELPDEERCIQEIIDEIAAFMKDTWLPGGVQRFGNTKTFGVVKGEFTVLDGLPDHLRHGVLAHERTYPAWVRFSGPGPYAPSDLDDYGQCSMAIKLMDVPGPKLMDDERFTQDVLLGSAPVCVAANVRENAKLQRAVRNETSPFYYLDPRGPLLVGLMQALYSRMHHSPLEVQYYSTVPSLLGAGQAVQYSLKPRSSASTKVPAKPADNYLRSAMARTLAGGDVSFDFMVQVQTDPRRMPIEDATVKWPEDLSPYVPVARLRLPRQRFDSDEQLAFANVLSYNPWHSKPEHRPLGNTNRARRRVYAELSHLRQSMNQAPHIEPTGAEQFPGSVPAESTRAGNGRPRRPPTTSRPAGG
ncbi:MAG TPA: hypothetical protein VG186_09450 [Solirubrobacteraceae bacterium]|jgi:hypothetical protein|nr:hypothetical protein [Solirubrobacteraceae bacterium]